MKYFNQNKKKFSEKHKFKKKKKILKKGTEQAGVTNKSAMLST